MNVGDNNDEWMTDEVFEWRTTAKTASEEMKGCWIEDSNGDEKSGVEERQCIMTL